MSENARDLITWLLTTLLATAALVSLGVRLILLPYLREHLVNPMREVQKQVTENHHSSQPPTVLDRIDDVQTEVVALAERLEEHIEHADAKEIQFWRALATRQGYEQP
jgi:hypothetical protein